MASSMIRGKHVICRAGADAAGTTVITDGAVFQEDGIIMDVGPYEALRRTCQPDEEIGGPNFLVIPGLVNTHSHGRGVTTLQMGACDDCLETWILAGWGRRSYDHYLMTLYTAMQMIESGTTSVMYNHPQTPVNGLENDVSEILRAFSDSGMRTAFSVYFRERNRVVYGDDEAFLSGLPADLAADVEMYLAALDLPQADYFQLFEDTYAKYGEDPGGRVTVPIASDYAIAKEKTAEMAIALGLDPVDAGPLHMARNIEAMMLLYYIPYVQGREMGWEFYFRRINYWMCNKYVPEGGEEEAASAKNAPDLAHIPDIHGPPVPCPQ